VSPESAADPLTQMSGAWYVEPTGDDQRSTVGMQFAFQPAPTLYGRVFAIAMHIAFPLVLRRIARGWRSAAEVPFLARRRRRVRANRRPD
jgi:hypothetical protein